jgi:hypothetical protein
VGGAMVAESTFESPGINRSTVGPDGVSLLWWNDSLIRSSPRDRFDVGSGSTRSEDSAGTSGLWSRVVRYEGLHP